MTGWVSVVNPSDRESFMVVAAWIYCAVGMAILLVTVARESGTVPASGPRIALMLIPASVALVFGLSDTGMSPSPLAAGTFALTWTILSEFHPVSSGGPRGQLDAALPLERFGRPSAAWLTVFLLTTD